MTKTLKLACYWTQCMTRIWRGLTIRLTDANKSAYARARSAAQKRLSEMKEERWSCRATELQDAFDRNDMKAFYDGLKAVCGFRDTGSARASVLINLHQGGCVFIGVI